MRTRFDRIRQAVSFELIGLALVVPLGSFLFGHGPGEMGVLAIIGATIATVWNYIYNLAFDHALRRLTGRPQKSLVARIVHALGFETSMLLLFLPVVAWWLDIGLIEALVLDIAFATFYVVYTFVFTLAYERIFPIGAAANA